MAVSAALRFNFGRQDTRKDASPLQFRDITMADVPAISRILAQANSLTCDYTIGGIFMWIKWFHYKICIYNDTLFISGVEENHTDRVAFSLPIGAMPLPRSIDLLKDYCASNGLTLQFSAIPADKLTLFTAYNPGAQVEELTDWSDYVYEIEAFASLSGKKMAKKRNHVNRFMADHLEAALERLEAANTGELISALVGWQAAAVEDGASATHDEELREVIEVLENMESYPFEGVVLRESPGGRPVAFALAEVINEMAFVHIEKMNHRVAGAGETIAHLMATHLQNIHPQVKFLNREEDCGDEGLRRAKESWHPAMLLRKYNVTL